MLTARVGVVLDHMVSLCMGHCWLATRREVLLDTAGLLFGIYSDAGDRTCLGYPGSRCGPWYMNHTSLQS